MAEIASGAAPPVFELVKVWREYGSDPIVHALVDINLRVERGEWIAITGPSGAGKSTLLNVIGCLDRPTRGIYRIDGIDAATLSDNERSALRSRSIGFVFQAFHLLPYRSVLENVMLAEIYRNERRPGREARALATLERVRLAHRAGFLPGKLSGGERQRVAIARAILGSPALLVCDEPTGNLDSKSSDAILELLEQLNREGLTLLMVTHNDEIARRAGRRLHMVDGALRELGAGAHAAARTRPVETVAATRVRRSRITSRDLLDEVLAGVLARPLRTLLTVLGVVIGITALVATMGLTRTAGNRIISQIDQLAATEVFVRAKPGRTTGIIDPRAIPWDAPARLARLNGVVAAGTLSEVEVGDALVSSSPVRDPLNQSAHKLAVLAASPELFRAVRAELASGRLLDAGNSERADRVAVLGPDAASRLGIATLEQLPAVAIGDHLFLVVGILRDVARRPELLGGVIVPEGTARRYFGLLGPGHVVVETRIGAAYLIADQAPYALRPDDPEALKLAVPQEPRRVRDEVQSDLSVMFLLLGGLSLLVGAIGIANITLVGVMERTGEIGLRRAIGATRAHITGQFLLESASLGIVGGVIGASVGILIVVAVSAYQVWTPVLDPLAPAAAPLLGGLIGLLSGLYPALRAAKLEPVEALRS